LRWAFVTPPPRVALETVTFENPPGEERPPYPPTYHSACAVVAKRELTVTLHTRSSPPVIQGLATKLKRIVFTMPRPRLIAYPEVFHAEFSVAQV
jgi:hypothetical protein